MYGQVRLTEVSNSSTRRIGNITTFYNQNAQNYVTTNNTLTNCYYLTDGNILGVMSYTGAYLQDAVEVTESKTESQLKQQSTFTNWDFNNTWNIEAGKMPTLKNMPSQP